MRGIVLFGAVVLLAAGAIYAGNRHDDRLFRDYERVRPGMSAADAKRILGEPSWQSRCGSRFPNRHSPACALELGYRSPFAPLKPLYWVVELDRQGRVIASHFVPSP